MPTPSIRYEVLIASPGDAGVQRDVVDEVIRDWNSSHARATGKTLHPLRWELDAVPELGDRPQGIINEQMVDHADIVIALFSTRLGSPTGRAASGTVEEIERMRSLGKRVMVYFSTAPVPRNHDVEQLRLLNAYKSDLTKRGLCEEFKDAADLRRKVTRHLANVMSTENASGTSSVKEEHHETTPAAPLEFSVVTKNIIYDGVQNAWRLSNQFDDPGESRAALIGQFSNPVPGKGMRGVDASGVVAHLRFRIPHHETVQVNRAYWMRRSESRINLESGDTFGVIIGAVAWDYWEAFSNPYERPAEEDFLQPALRHYGQGIKLPKSNMHVDVSLISPDGTALEVKGIDVEFRNGFPSGVVVPND